MRDDPPSSASEWVIRLSESALSSEAQAALEHWLASDSQNRADFAKANAAWLAAGSLEKSVKARELLEKLRNEQHLGTESDRFETQWVNPFRSLVLKLAPAFVGIVLIIVIGVWPTDQGPQLPSLDNGEVAITGIDEITRYALPDGSTLTINADSVLRVEFTKNLRQVILERGQAFFEIQHNARKPFAVVAGPRRVAVTGTQFDVRYNANNSPIQVAVIEGRVTVSASSQNLDAASDMALSVGDVFSFPENGQPVRLQLAAHLVSSWQIRRLYFDNVTLREALFEVNRYAPKRLVLTDSDLAELRISGAFRAGDTEAFLFSLREIHNINVRDDGDTWLLSDS